MNTEAAENPSASAPDTVTADLSAGILSPAVKAAWRGEKPAPKTEESAPQPSERPSAGELDEETPASTETVSASDPDNKPQEIKGKKGEKHSGTPRDERVKELLADRSARDREIADLRRQLQERTTPPKQESAPAPKAEPAKAEAPKKPVWNDFKDKENGFEEYEAAKDTYYDERAKHEARLAVDQDRQERARAEATARLQGQLKEVSERYPDAENVIIPLANEILSNEAIHPVLKGLIDSSPVLPDLMYVLGSGDKKVLAEFVQLAKSDPYQAVRYLVTHEQLVKEQLSKPKAESKEVNEPKSEKSATPAPPRTPTPKVPVEVGARSSPPEDEREAAVKAGDWRRFKEAEDRRHKERGKPF